MSLEEAAPVSKDQPDSDRFDIDHCESGAPPPRRQASARQSAPGYMWNGMTQELIPTLPKDHPDYEANAALVAAAIRRWRQMSGRLSVPELLHQKRMLSSPTTPAS
jgi:hypothetical protein